MGEEKINLIIITNQIGIKIFLDDQINDPETPNRHPKAGWTGVKNFAEFKALVEKTTAAGEPIEEISFDNDLGEGEPEGHEILNWLAKNFPEIVVGETIIDAHSANGPERKAMVAFLKSYRRNKDILLEMKNRPDTGIPLSKL